MALFRIAALLLALALAGGAAMAEDAAPDAQPPQRVDGPEISTLIRSTLVALDQANVTGNYTVLRDLGASAMQSANSAADLATFFADFRQKRMSLAAAVLLDAVLDEAPKLTTDGTLHLVGHFPTKPQEIVFDLTFFFERGDWRIASLKVGTRLAGAADAGGGQPAAKPADSGTSAKPPPLPRTRPKP